MASTEVSESSPLVSPPEENEKKTDARRSLRYSFWIVFGLVCFGAVVASVLPWSTWGSSGVVPRSAPEPSTSTLGSDETVGNGERNENHVWNRKRMGDFMFDMYMKEFNKKYESEDEYNLRRDIFHKSLAMARNHNYATLSDGTQKHKWIMRYNQFSDMLPSEVPKGLDKEFLRAWRAQEALGEGSGGTSSSSSSSVLFSSVLLSSLSDRRNLGDLPASVDWRKRSPPVTTAVKNQGFCGSCWAVAATAALESHLAISTGKLLTLPSQELVSCSPNPNHCGGDGGCAGSTQELAFDYVSKHGMLTEWPDGYTSFLGRTGECKRTEDSVGPLLSIAGFASLPTNSYDNLMWAVATIGPVVIAIAADSWMQYSAGVFDDSHMTEHYDINHAVVVEGYGTDERTGEDYWLVRNSWGEKWGENGYIRLKRTDPSSLGVDDPLSVSSGYCKMDVTPLDGTACAGPFGNETVDDELACGTSGILYSASFPVGAHLVGL